MECKVENIQESHVEGTVVLYRVQIKNAQLKLPI